MRYRFGPAFGHAMRVRGLDLSKVATMADVSPATASSAVRGRSLNLRTAIRLARAVSQCPVLPELEWWCDKDISEEFALREESLGEVVRATAGGLEHEPIFDRRHRQSS